MKKRVKLLTTIASLCLAVALMAFGVYAATSSTFNVTSHVSFEANVAVAWKANVSGGHAVTVDGENREVATGVLDISEQTLTMNAQTKEDGSANKVVVTNAVDGKDSIPAEIEFENKDNATITYKFSCLNNGDSDITVTVTHTAIPETANLKVSYKTENGTAEATTTWEEENTVKAGEKITFTVELKMVDPATGVTATPVTADFTASH